MREDDHLPLLRLRHESAGDRPTAKMVQRGNGVVEDDRRAMVGGGEFRQEAGDRYAARLARAEHVARLRQGNRSRELDLMLQRAGSRTDVREFDLDFAEAKILNLFRKCGA